MLRALFLALAMLAAPAAAQDVVADLNQNRVAITANFDGSEILIFGAVKWDTPTSAQAPVDVIVTVTGPRADVTIRKKDRVAGIWVNTSSADIQAAPSFYKVVTTKPLAEILSPEQDIEHRISVPRAIGTGRDDLGIIEMTQFLPALIRIRRANGLYTHTDGAVELVGDTLFNATIKLPSNLVEGTYAARTFLVREGRVIAEHNTSISVQKVGLEKWIYRLAHDNPLVYGILSLVIAIAAGWGAAAVFRYIRI